MTEIFNYLFQYLEKEGITINKSEFEFQIQSHPDYPTLVSIADTLSFFNIDNGALSIEKSEIELLPDRFVALLDIENNEPRFYLVEKKDDVYFLDNNKQKKKLSKQELELRWKNIVLLVEKSATDNFTKTNKSKLFWILSFLCLGLFTLMVMQFQISLEIKFFFVFPIVGVLFSVAALKDLFGTNSELLNNFCNMTSFSSCTTIVSSSKWKIFKIVNFSDLSMIFFGSQFFGLLLFLFATDTTTYFSIQKIILLCSIPVLLTSVYYQKFVEKKWCPICLVIIAVILLELVYIYSLLQISIEFLMYSIIIFGFVFVSVTLIWFGLKKLLTQQKELIEFQIKGNRFMRNYKIFKNNLLAADPIENIQMLSTKPIVLGNPNASLKIVVVTSPFCGFCAEAHIIIEEILEKYSEKLCFDIRFNFNEANGDNNSKKIHQQLLSVYFNLGQRAFIEAMHDWFEDKNEPNIFKNLEINELLSDLILEEQFNWNQINHINYTPAIIINGYFLPKEYDRNDLKYFINDLADDESLAVVYEEKLN